MMTLDESKQGNGNGKSKRGFAVMNPERQREIARLGGIAAHRSGHAHQFTTEEARAAGKKRHEPRGDGRAA
jgi:general stress protein YciG